MGGLREQIGLALVPIAVAAAPLHAGDFSIEGLAGIEVVASEELSLTLSLQLFRRA
jgi:hypothetical protein